MPYQLVTQLTYQLLKIMKYNGNIWELVHGGYEFGQVAYFLDKLKENHYICADANGKITITPIGEAFLSGFEANNSIKKYSKWVMPRNEMWNKPAGSTFIYVPKG